MANSRSSAKRARQAEKRRVANKYYTTTARTYIKRANAQIDDGEFEEAKETIRLASKMLDKAAQKNIIHRNNAARRKSRLVKAFNKAVLAQNEAE